MEHFSKNNANKPNDGIRRPEQSDQKRLEQLRSDAIRFINSIEVPNGKENPEPFELTKKTASMILEGFIQKLNQRKQQKQQKVDQLYAYLLNPITKSLDSNSGKNQKVETPQVFMIHEQTTQTMKNRLDNHVTSLIPDNPSRSLEQLREDVYNQFDQNGKEQYIRDVAARESAYYYSIIRWVEDRVILSMPQHSRRSCNQVRLDIRDTLDLDEQERYDNDLKSYGITLQEASNSQADIFSSTTGPGPAYGQEHTSTTETQPSLSEEQFDAIDQFIIAKSDPQERRKQLPKDLANILRPISLDQTLYDQAKEIIQGHPNKETAQTSLKAFREMRKYHLKNPRSANLG